MLYLEDYLEMIEHLPQELRDRFTEMREMDLSVQNNMDTLEKRVRTLFGSCRRGEISKDQADTEMTDIKRCYGKTLEEAEEKVALANQMSELVDRYLRRLDTELHKFKCELEADNKGITELLEKRSLELDVNTNHNNSSSNNHYIKDSRYRIRAEKRWGTRDRAHAAPASLSRTDSAIQAALGRESYGLGPGSAIAAAASQAIAATQQMTQGRRSISMKASYNAVTAGDLSHHTLHQVHHTTHHDHGHGLPHAHAHGGASLHTPHAHAANKRHNKQKKTSYGSTSSVSSHTQQSVSACASRSSSPTAVLNSSMVNNVAMEEPIEEEWTYDPNEPRYCICNHVSYGDMVACDNQDCPYEWFHYNCVGITAPPKGKWYCPQCQTNLRRNRAHRKN